VADEPPRRRISDRDRRRWNDDRLDDLKENVDDLQAEHRAVARLPGEVAAISRLLEQYMAATDSRLDRMHTTLERLRDENRVAHKRVAYGVDPEDGTTPLPPHPATLTWGAVAKIATIIGTFFGSAAIIVAALLSAQ
jgi:hypothetical protein